ncbi:MarR family winged helix-turn-helix transcriptional regulator [Paenibacillus abyssi]|uniref:MarR family transcriptional regulator n=1 Tax=Paenibacillus abyssi TaxID=1340531 RepID=A0A917CT92_9BACL|nr:MarR family transcriptional regulator [Paenibacillus abyssi]GGF95369.1 MarR family transcriptional regulator [Paenibacillus abyssi]
MEHGNVSDEERDAALKLENQLCFAVYACSREMTKLYHPLLKEIGLTYTQYVTMLALWEKDQVTVKELGARLYLDSGTLTPLLKKLESMGLITRSRHKADERSVIIALTKQGTEMKEKAREIPAKLYGQSGISLEEIHSLRQRITELLTKVQQP